jgi:23S rRNA pseudouridine955/2504/2580 synthase
VSESRVQFIELSDEESGQRLDNYLMRVLGGVPKTRIYKAIRTGEVRVNKGRAKPERKLNAGDVIRIPPISIAAREEGRRVPDRWSQRIDRSIIHNDSELMVIDKPTGLAVHGGSGVQFGLIESLRQMFPDQRYMELVHRLDRDTSGLVMIAKRASVLRELHTLLRGDGVDKRYLALVVGKWPAYRARVEASLEKSALPSGERIVRVTPEGRRSLTDFRVIERYRGATLIEAKPVTGRTHQIRVHAQHAGHPILGDAKYGSEEQLNIAKTHGLKRLFLHAQRLEFRLGGQRYCFEAPLDNELSTVCDSFGSKSSG